jgi:hypothetical protein
MPPTKKQPKWLELPEKHDYAAALSYLTLLYGHTVATDLEDDLAEASMSGFKAKDILRASELPLLGNGNVHVFRDLKKINDGEKLSPILLVAAEKKLIIADGYHRVCAVYNRDEDASIPAKLVTY